MTTNQTDPWVQTFSGVAFDLLTPRVEDVQINDIAISLSRLARYAGHTRGTAINGCGYSVAQHSVLVADLLRTWGADAKLQREGLLHDAAEAYYGDITSPVQRALIRLGGGDALVALKERVDAAVRRALMLTLDEPPLVRRADLVALAIERRWLMAPCERDWNLPELADTRWSGIEVLDASNCYRAFLARLNELDASITSDEARV
jgi:5'-deoxynucleotidase YfbR-like HD superfamily hydrolase